MYPVCTDFRRAPRKVKPQKLRVLPLAERRFAISSGGMALPEPLRVLAVKSGSRLALSDRFAQFEQRLPNLGDAAQFGRRLEQSSGFRVSIRARVDRSCALPRGPATRGKTRLNASVHRREHVAPRAENDGSE